MDSLCKLLLTAALLIALQPACLAESAPTLNTHYTPALLPEKAFQRGICISGDARLVELSPNHYRMSCGMILIDTDVPMQIDTHRGSIYAKAHTAVLISKTKEALRVFNLHDRARNSVQLKFGKNLVNLNAGIEGALLDKSIDNPIDIAVCKRVGYRKPKVLSVNDKENLVILEFSIADKLKHGKIFTQLRESPIPQDQKLLAQIEKTAAAINLMFHKNIGVGGVARGRGWVTDNGEGREAYADHEKRQAVKSKLAQDKELAI
jgi:hypothetical protein